LPAKLVVTATPKGSRIALLGSSGKQLLASAVFTEPRAKGATLRALRGILGEGVTVEDNTTVASLRKGANGVAATAEAATAEAETAEAPAAPARGASKRRGAAKAAGKRVSRRAAAPNGAAPARAAASPAKRARRRTPKS
jgi:hypothetical protein